MLMVEYVGGLCLIKIEIECFISSTSYYRGQQFIYESLVLLLTLFSIVFFSTNAQSYIVANGCDLWLGCLEREALCSTLKGLPLCG
jgi:hypothetical protein